jgi:hypothetical protein
MIGSDSNVNRENREETKEAEMNGASVSGETMRSLFKINKQAVIYAERAYLAYQDGHHRVARRNSARKEALYGLKAAVLREIIEEADSVDRHRINDSVYLCLGFRQGENQWSFHCPTEDIDSEAVDGCGEIIDVDDFQKSGDTGEVNRTLKESLVHLKERFEENANAYLPEEKRRVKGDFSGWTYL